MRVEFLTDRAVRVACIEAKETCRATNCIGMDWKPAALPLRKQEHRAGTSGFSVDAER